MIMISQIGLFLLAALLFAAGVSHFLRPRFYARMLPLWLPAHKFLVAVSGAIEIILAVGLLFEASRSPAAWGTIVMLFAYLLVHFHMVLDKEAGMGLPNWALWLRILLQFVLMWLAMTYT